MKQGLTIILRSDAQPSCPSDYFGFRTEAKAINMTLWNATEPGQAPLPEQTLVDTLLQKYQEQYTLLFFGSVGIVIASNAVMMLRFTLQGTLPRRVAPGRCARCVRVCHAYAHTHASRARAQVAITTSCATVGSCRSCCGRTACTSFTGRST